MVAAHRILYQFPPTIFDTASYPSAVFYNQLSSMDGNVRHSGDNKTGKGEGYDEEITIKLESIPGVSVIVIVLSAFSGGTLKECECASCDIKAADTMVENQTLSIVYHELNECFLGL